MTRSAESADRSDPVIAAVRKSDAASLRVYLGDGTEKAVAISKARNRWSKLLEVLDTMQWERIECLDSKSNVLHVIESEEDFDIDDADEEIGKQGKLAKVMLSLLKSTMTETRKMFETQMKANAELVKAMTEGLQQLHTAHRLAMQVQLTHFAKQEGDDNGPMNQVLQMLAMQMVPQLMSSKPSAPPVNAKGHP